MKEEKKVRKRVELTERELEQVRADFSKLTLVNPNYFGNIPESKFKPELLMTKETTYEDISCVGFNPNRDMLYATLRVKLNSGYSGDLCSAGSYEYVRFYVDWDGDGDFEDPDEDVGLVSVNVHDIPGSKPLNYCVTLKIDPSKKPCTMPQKVQVRAVLSWNAAPPPNTPNYTPVWGEMEDRWIQIDPSSFVLADLIDMTKIKLEPTLVKNLNLAQPIAKPATLSPMELKELYKDLDVPEHRLNIKQVSMHTEKLSKNVNVAVSELKTSVSIIPDTIKEGLIQALTSPLDVKYEELHCVGLQYAEDALAAILTVKLPYGYSGNLCTDGSYEYVVFWADWDNTGTFDEYLGTAAVNVHDIPDIPSGGLQYAVYLPVNMASKRRPCTDPRIVRIRAILSWQVPPSPTDPNYDPVWGNHVDALIQIKPGVSVPEDVQLPFVSAVGDVAVIDIDANGYATGTGIISGFQAEDSPFGGTVTISGHISNPPNLSAGATPLKYSVSYRKVAPGEPWIKFTNKFQITIAEWDGAAWSEYHLDQTVDPEGYYSYREDLAVSPPVDLTQRFVEGFVMGKWYTGGLSDGLYEVKVSLKTPAGDVDSNIVRVRLDNTSPTAHVSITEIVVNGSPQPATPCGTFPSGSLIKGKFTASDTHFWKYWFAVEPASLNPNSVSPQTEAHPVLPAPGAMNKDWQLNTANMQPCGYVVYLHVRDRTIVNSGYKGWYNKFTVGFCLTGK